MYLLSSKSFTQKILLIGLLSLQLSCSDDPTAQKATPDTSEEIASPDPEPVTSTEQRQKKNCSDAQRYADDAYSYSNRIYISSSNLSDAQSYARQAKSAFDDAKRAARDCGCDKAYRYADDGYSYANRAYNASTLSDAQSLGRQAKNAADDAKTAARSCESEDKE